MRMRRGAWRTELKARVVYQAVQHSERGFMDVWFALVARRKGRRARHLRRPGSQRIKHTSVFLLDGMQFLDTSERGRLI